jgi:hypothetical protein
MSAPLIELADEVTALINTVGAFTPALGAIRSFQLLYDLPTLANPKVTTFPVTDRTVERTDRGAWKHEMVVEIAVQQKTADDENTNRDPIVNTANAIRDYIAEQWPEDSAYELMEPTVQSVVQHPLLLQNRLFTSLVRLMFHNYR